MIFQALNLKSKRKSGEDPSALEAGLVEIGEDDTRDEAALRLERELAVVLARKPKHRAAAKPSTPAIEDDAPFIAATEPEGVSRAGRAESAPDPAMPAAMDARLSSEVATSEVTLRPAASPEEAQQRWMQSSRRKRRSLVMRKTASFVITLCVTAFIVSLTAVFLFGLPEDLAGFTAKPSPAELERTTFTGMPHKLKADAGDPTSAPVRLRWVAN